MRNDLVDVCQREAHTYFSNLENKSEQELKKMILDSARDLESGLDPFAIYRVSSLILIYCNKTNKSVAEMVSTAHFMKLV